MHNALYEESVNPPSLAMRRSRSATSMAYSAMDVATIKGGWPFEVERPNEGRRGPIGQSTTGRRIGDDGRLLTGGSIAIAAHDQIDGRAVGRCCTEDAALAAFAVASNSTKVTSAKSVQPEPADDCTETGRHGNSSSSSDYSIAGNSPARWLGAILPEARRTPMP